MAIENKRKALTGKGQGRHGHAQHGQPPASEPGLQGLGRQSDASRPRPRPWIIRPVSEFKGYFVPGRMHTAFLASQAALVTCLLVGQGGLAWAQLSPLARADFPGLGAPEQ